MPEIKYFEEYELGEIRFSRGRTMTEADVRLFIGCTDNTHQIHVNEKFCKEDQGMDGTVIQGVLTLAVADGFMAQEISPCKMFAPHYGYDKVRWIKPVFCGDTIHSEMKIVKKAVRNNEYGMLDIETTVKNQHGEPVLYCIDKLLVNRRPE